MNVARDLPPGRGCLEAVPSMDAHCSFSFIQCEFTPKTDFERMGEMSGVATPKTSHSVVTAPGWHHGGPTQEELAPRSPPFGRSMNKIIMPIKLTII